MKFMYPLAERVRRGEPIPPYLSVLLTAATPIQRAGMWLRLRSERVRIAARVISFGNITAGGTGKTPAVIERAIKEIAAGHNVGILTRGYGSIRRHESLMTVRGIEAASMWETIGDEPALIARKAPEAIIGCCADRVRGALALVEQYACDTLIVDDGFQFVRLERDENIVLIDAANPFGNGRVIPRGILREPLSALSRATHVIMTRCDQAKDPNSVMETVHRHCPHARIRTTRHAPTSLWRVSTNEQVSLDSLQDERVIALSAIAAPETFTATLRALGANVIEKRVLPDHVAIPDNALRSDVRIITTEKDAVRLRNAPENVFALGIELRDMQLP